VAALPGAPAPSDVVSEVSVAPVADPALARVQEEALESLRNTVAFLESQLAQVKADFEKVSKELVGETAAKVDAQIARDLAELRARRLEEKITEAADPGESAAIQTSLSRVEVQLEHNRREVERLARELEAERTGRVKAETNVKALQERLRRLRAEVLDRLTVEEPGPDLDLEDSDAMLELMMPVGEEVPEIDEGELDKIKETLVQEPAKEPVRHRRVLPLIGGIAAMLVGAALTVFGIYFAYHNGDWSEFRMRNLGQAKEVDITPPPEPQPPVEQETASPSPQPAAPVAPPAAESPASPAQADNVAPSEAQPPAATPAPAPPPPPPPRPEPTGPGKLEVSADFHFKSGGEEKTASAAGTPIVLAPIKLNKQACEEFLDAAGIDKAMHEVFAQWLYIGRPEQAKVEQFAEPCRLLGVYANQLGRENFTAKLAALMQIEPPDKWMEARLADDGKAILESIDSGRYLVLPRPEGDKQAWAVPPPVTLEDERVAVIRKDETTELLLTLTDEKSAIRGIVVDAESGSPVAAAKLTLTGDAAPSEEGFPVVSGDDGTFTIDPAQVGYGNFTIKAAGLPEGYRAATLYQGARQQSVATPPVAIEFTKSGFKKVIVSGRVLTADGQPAKGLPVFRISRDGGEQKLATADDAGEYRVETPKWPLRLFATGPGNLRSEVVELSPELGEHVRRDIIMPATGRIVLNVRKPDDSVPESLDGFSLKCGAQEIKAADLIARDGDTFVLPWLAPGEYELTFKSAGFRDVSLKGLVIDEQHKEVKSDVRLEPAAQS
jgi:hypothetical protein